MLLQLPPKMAMVGMVPIAGIPFSVAQAILQANKANRNSDPATKGRDTAMAVIDWLGVAFDIASGPFLVGSLITSITKAVVKASGQALFNLIFWKVVKFATRAIIRPSAQLTLKAALPTPPPNRPATCTVHQYVGGPAGFICNKCSHAVFVPQ